MSAFCSLSANPPLILVCVDLVSNTLPAIRASGEFTVNFLADGSEETARRFASKSTEKFSDLRCQQPLSGKGGPVLTDVCSAYLACTAIEELRGGDHAVFVGRVEEAMVVPGTSTLLYGQHTFGHWPLSAGEECASAVQSDSVSAA